jgi:predicted RNA-binding Zn-ribbon protein involved in translation (DUF1610 family)
MDSKTDYLNCPFCSHLVLSKNGKCPGCRHRLEPLYFGKIYCPHCGTHDILENSKCRSCGKKIVIPEFETGKYIEIPKRRRYKLISEREEALYQNMKNEHTQKISASDIEVLKRRAISGRKNYMVIFYLVIINFAVFALLSSMFGIFKQEALSVNQSEVKFFIPVVAWFFIKAAIYTVILIFSLKKPIYSCLIGIVSLAVFFIFESVSFPVLNKGYLVSQIISFLLLIYSAKLSITYEDYLTRYV